MLIHPVGDLAQPLEAVHRLAAAGKFMIFAFKQTGASLDVQHF